ncbi:clathrin light chain CLC1 [Aspergillus clavatus NRRL 1]|uniref:Clathrin light chain n=1 Tax=Aspergillus clavatus (strain ATCC 1007 / CBS 513.65 / DSM 816 / NCTC 3887 / NRRL 1 / QM 1276 / 107) TaxID=344612 RepID=A1CHU7_ASPCL|nr:clathrin light chain [Aspergillus clavatus NRRL 1]EAW10452.1 clathrin light chain [Aspergillus clavatus NRRL 1]
MADRFPSLEEFSAGQTDVVETNDPSDENDFLARERAMLGDDAEQFATAQDHVATAESLDTGNDLLGGAEETPVGESAHEEISGFESSFPAIETQNEQVAPGGTITGTGAPFPPTGYASYGEPSEEPEPVREWRERRDAEITRRAEISNEKKEATINKAREDIDDFYVSYNNKTDKLRAQTRADAEQFLANREDTSAGGTSWERIAKLVDISGKGTKGGASGSGKERFRELLLDLKKDQNAPGVTGI